MFRFLFVALCFIFFVSQAACSGDTNTVAENKDAEIEDAETTVAKNSGTQSSKKYLTTDGLAVKGYDVVSYFQDPPAEKSSIFSLFSGDPIPLEGKQEWNVKWQNAEWRFSSEENKKLFLEQPEKYAPQYGGWCAYGVAEGALVAVDPEAWSIVNGKLYLNYSSSVRKKWLKDTQGYIDFADKKYPTLVN